MSWVFNVFNYLLKNWILNDIFPFSCISSYCSNQSHCVTASGNYKVIFGSGTKLTVEISEYYRYSFKKHNVLNNSEGKGDFPKNMFYKKSFNGLSTSWWFLGWNEFLKNRCWIITNFKNSTISNELVWNILVIVEESNTVRLELETENYCLVKEFDWLLNLVSMILTFKE